MIDNSVFPKDLFFCVGFKMNVVLDAYDKESFNLVVDLLLRGVEETIVNVKLSYLSKDDEE